ncbi:MAG: TlpA family protein disulfide reductase [Dehalococcoidia bacterium]
MGKGRKSRHQRRRDRQARRGLAFTVNKKRLRNFALLSAVVAGVAALLFAAGILGGGSAGVADARMVATPPSPSDPDLRFGTNVGRLAPNFEASDFQGNRIQLSNFRDRPVYVNFWATWCTQCRQELEDMQRLMEEHGDSGLAIIAINVGERLNQAQSYLANLGVDFTANAMDPSTTVWNSYRILGMPASVFIDADGVIQEFDRGRITYRQMVRALGKVTGTSEEFAGTVVKVYQDPNNLSEQSLVRISPPSDVLRQALSQAQGVVSVEAATWDAIDGPVLLVRYDGQELNPQGIRDILKQALTDNPDPTLAAPIEFEYVELSTVPSG